MAHRTGAKWNRRYRRESGDTKITPFADRLVKMLEIDTRRQQLAERSARGSRTPNWWWAPGIRGDYSRVTVHPTLARCGGAGDQSPRAAAIEPGEAHHLIRSEERLVIGGVAQTARRPSQALQPAFVRPGFIRHKVTKCCSMRTRAFAALGGIRAGTHDKYEDGETKSNEGKRVRTQDALRRDGLALPVRSGISGNVASG